MRPLYLRLAVLLILTLPSAALSFNQEPYRLGPLHNPIHSEFYERVVLSGLLVSCDKNDSLDGLFPSKQELQAFIDGWVEEHKSLSPFLVSHDWDMQIFVLLVRWQSLSHGINIGVSKGQVYINEFAHQQFCEEHLAKAHAILETK